MTLRPGEQPFTNQTENFFRGRHICFGVYLESSRDFYSRGAYVTVRARVIFMLSKIL